MRKVIFAIGTGASIIGLSTLPGIPYWAKLMIGVFGIFAFGYLVIDDIRSSRRNEKVYHC